MGKITRAIVANRFICGNVLISRAGLLLPDFFQENRLFLSFAKHRRHDANLNKTIESPARNDTTREYSVNYSLRLLLEQKPSRRFFTLLV